MSQIDEELAKRTEELRRLAGEMSRDFRKFAADFHEQMQVFADDVRKRARGASPFEESAIEKIKALAELREQGIVTEEEFQQQKKRLLDQI